MKLADAFKLIEHKIKPKTIAGGQRILKFNL
jgi:hypothetical protein